MWKILCQTSSSSTAAGFYVGPLTCSEVVTHGVWKQQGWQVFQPQTTFKFLLSSSNNNRIEVVARRPLILRFRRAPRKYQNVFWSEGKIRQTIWKEESFEISRAFHWSTSDVSERKTLRSINTRVDTAIIYRLARLIPYHTIVLFFWFVQS